ncbi:hypothetical protein J6590_033284 [Homalodisca vitripennis]|nr:hypothetical protein J6590_033284 [Homalodisca vitripennis]
MAVAKNLQTHSEQHWESESCRNGKAKAGNWPCSWASRLPLHLPAPAIGNPTPVRQRSAGRLRKSNSSAPPLLTPKRTITANSTTQVLLTPPFHSCQLQRSTTANSTTQVLLTPTLHPWQLQRSTTANSTTQVLLTSPLYPYQLQRSTTANSTTSFANFTSSTPANSNVPLLQTPPLNLERSDGHESILNWRLPPEYSDISDNLQGRNIPHHV